MAELKTKKNTASIEKFLNSVTDEQRRKDCFQLLEMMKAATKAEPAMWGTSIVGFGRYQYVQKWAPVGVVSDRLLAAQTRPDLVHNAGTRALPQF